MDHKTLGELEKELIETKKKIVIGGIYSHYKNPQNHYKVHGFAVQEATNNICVLYEALYMPGVIFVRDVDIWLQKVKVSGRSVERFRLIT